MKRIVLTLIAALPLMAQHRITLFANQAQTEQGWMRVYDKSNFGSFDVFGPASSSANYSVALPSLVTPGCIIAPGIADADGHYDLNFSQCFAVNAHKNAAGVWIADGSSAAAGNISGSTFTLDGASGLTAGGVIGWTPMMTTNLSHPSLHFAPLDGDVTPYVDNSVNFGDSSHHFADFWSHGIIHSNGLLPEVDNTSPIGSAAHPFGPLFTSALNVGTLLPAVDNTSTLGASAHRWGNVYTVDIDSTGAASLGTVSTSGGVVVGGNLSATNITASLFIAGSSSGISWTATLTTGGGTCTVTFTAGILTNKTGAGC